MAGNLYVITAGRKKNTQADVLPAAVKMFSCTEQAYRE